MPTPPPPVPEPEPEGPDTVVGALREIQRERARRRALLAAAFVVVAGVGVAGTTLTEQALARATTGVTAAAQLPVQMQPVHPEEVTAALALNEKAWGTEVIMRCHYQGGGDEPAPPVYVLVARTDDGATAELARWKAVPDRDVVLATATDLTRQRLAALEVRDTQGTVLLRTDHI